MLSFCFCHGHCLPGGGEEEMNVDLETPEEEPLGGVGRPKR